MADVTHGRQDSPKSAAADKVRADGVFVAASAPDVHTDSDQEPLD